MVVVLKELFELRMRRVCRLVWLKGVWFGRIVESIDGLFSCVSIANLEVSIEMEGYWPDLSYLSLNWEQRSFFVVVGWNALFGRIFIRCNLDDVSLGVLVSLKLSCVSK